jgi:hypothetical protein
MPNEISKKLYQSIFEKHIRDAIKHPNKKTKSYDHIRREFKEFIQIDINFKYILTEEMLELNVIGKSITEDYLNFNQEKDDEIRNFQDSYISNVYGSNEITLYNQLSHFRDIPESFKNFLTIEGEKISKLIKTNKSPKDSKQITILEFKDSEESLQEEIFSYFDWLKDQKDCTFFEISQCMYHITSHRNGSDSYGEMYKLSLEVSKILFQSKCKLKRFFISDIDLRYTDRLCKEIWFFSLWFTKGLEFSVSEFEIKVIGGNGFFTVSRECFFSAFMGRLCDAYDFELTGNPINGSACLLIELEREIVSDNFKSFNNAIQKYRDQVGVLSFTEDEIKFIATFFIEGDRCSDQFGNGYMKEEFEAMSYIPQLSKATFTYLIKYKNEKNIFFLGTGYFYIEPLEFLNDLKEFYTILSIGNHKRLAQSFIVLHVLRAFLSVVITDSIWLRIIQLINETLDQTQRENIISVLNLFAPENSELKIELDDNYQHQNIYKNEVIKLHAEDEASSFCEKILLSQFSKDQILKYFKNLRFNERENLNNHDNILLPLFKAAEDHLKLYLTDQGIDFGRSTDLSNLINRIQDHIKKSPHMSNFKSKWRKEKGKFFRIITIRNQTAHASIFDASLIEPTQENVKKLLCFVEELRE